MALVAFAFFLQAFQFFQEHFGMRLGRSERHVSRREKREVTNSLFFFFFVWPKGEVAPSYLSYYI